MDKEKLLKISDKLLKGVMLNSGIIGLVSLFYINSTMVIISSILNIIFVLSYLQIRKYADMIVLGSQLKSGLGSMASMLDNYG